MSITAKMETWALPDRTAERVQLTLRLNYNAYARLHALKAVYPHRAVNDFLNDIIDSGLDEIVEALPSRTISEHEAAEMAGSEEEYDLRVGAKTGPRVVFDSVYRRILTEKSSDDSGNQEAA